MINEYYPLGSVVKLKNIDLEFMIVSRGCFTEDKESRKMFDYAGCLYPQGLIDKNVSCFNNEDIEKVIFKGYISEKEEEIQDILEKAKKMEEGGR